MEQTTKFEAINTELGRFHSNSCQNQSPHLLHIEFLLQTTVQHGNSHFDHRGSLSSFYARNSTRSRPNAPRRHRSTPTPPVRLLSLQRLQRFNPSFSLTLCDDILLGATDAR